MGILPASRNPAGRAGSTDEAVAMYERSLVLNPDNTNGKEALAKIRSTA